MLQTLIVKTSVMSVNKGFIIFHYNASQLKNDNVLGTLELGIEPLVNLMTNKSVSPSLGENFTVTVRVKNGTHLCTL